MDSVTEENVAKIMKERDLKQSELQQLKGTSEKQLWLNELAKLRTEYIKMIDEFTKGAATTTTKPTSVVKKIKKSVPGSKKA